MMKHTLIGSALLAVLGFSNVVLADDAPSSPNSTASADWTTPSGYAPSYNWYVAPRIGAVIPDSSRRTDSSLLLGLGIGRWFGPNNTIDIEGTVNNADFKRRAGFAGDKQWESVGVNITGRHYWGNENDRTRFYGLLGVGALHHAAVSTHKGWSPTASVGAGVQYAFNDRIALRGEVAYRWDHDDTSSHYIPGAPHTNHYGDGLVSIGLVMGLDHKSRPAPPNRVASLPPPPSDCSKEFRNGVNLCENKCPNLPEGSLVGPDGCPQNVVIDLHGINFKFDRPRKSEANIGPTLQEPTAESQAILDQAVDTLQRYPSVHVQVVGYTDSVGTEQYNQGLSERRANLVNRYLLSHGIEASRLDSPQGMGENDPLDTNSTAEGRARNRRVEFHVDQANAPSQDAAPIQPSDSTSSSQPSN